MMQLTRSGLTLLDSAPFTRWQEEFAERNCVVIPRLFDDVLMQSITKNINAAVFYPCQHFGPNDQEFARDLTMRENELALHQIHLVLNNHGLFRAVQTLTGCDPIGSFSGRIYQNLPQADHQLNWHSDTENGARLIGISINFSAEPYEGGVFQIRESSSGRVTGEVGYGQPGDAHLFRISPKFQHRVTSTEGRVTRIVASGWFVSEPGIGEALKSLFAN